MMGHNQLQIARQVLKSYTKFVVRREASAGHHACKGWMAIVVSGFLIGPSLTNRPPPSDGRAGGHRRRLVIDIGRKPKFLERRQSWRGWGVGSPGFWVGEGRRGGSRRGPWGSQNIISYNVQKYDENTEHGSKGALIFGKNLIICA